MLHRLLGYWMLFLCAIHLGVLVWVALDIHNRIFLAALGNAAFLLFGYIPWKATKPVTPEP